MPTIAIGPRYFETLRLGVLRGRTFTDADGRPGRDTVIVNQRFIDTYLPGASGLGERIRLAPQGSALADGPALTIVGVRDDPAGRGVRVASGRLRAAPIPLDRQCGDHRRRSVGAASATPLLRREVALLDADVTLFNVGR